LSSLQHLLDSNRQWAQAVIREEPDFFNRLSQQQTPEYLWIGCSDSRVPATQIVGLAPGEIFVHRSIANVVVHTDLNCLSVVQFAVDVLKVKHIIVCGHYGCGGVKAAMESQEHGLIDNWLRHIRDVQRFHSEEIKQCVGDQEKFDRLCERNVMEQVMNVCNTTIVQQAWRAGQDLSIHGWIYSIEDGLIRNLGVTLSGVEDV